MCPNQAILGDGCFEVKLWFHRGVCFPDDPSSCSSPPLFSLLNHLPSLPPSPLSPTDDDEEEDDEEEKDDKEEDNDEEDISGNW